MFGLRVGHRRPLISAGAAEDILMRQTSSSVRRGRGAGAPKHRPAPDAPRDSLPKCPTGILGLDQITLGGLPRGRPTLVCGGTGCGKTLLGMEFLLHGAQQYGEPGVFMAFEESAAELVQNVASLGYDLNKLLARKKLVLDYVRFEPAEILETGEYDLEGLFVRLGHAVDSIGARRVVLDTIECLFGGLSNQTILRAELRRLFRWLKDRGLTAIITGERGSGTLTREGLEEYVSDCVILLEHRLVGAVSTRRLRVVKYRGSTHGTNEYPFLIDSSGISVVPVTSLQLDHPALDERISSGVPRLDSMFGGGVFRGSTVLVSGTAGTGKTSLAAHFAAAACRRGERALFCAFEESSRQLLRNMRSIGLNLRRFVTSARLCFSAQRPTTYGLEMHLALIHKQVQEFQPHIVIFDPISGLSGAGGPEDTRAAIMRLVDHLKSQQITAVFTSLTQGGTPTEATDVGLSSLVDVWLLLRDLELSGERNRTLNILKERGSAHSNQVREFRLTDHGIELLDVYTGPEGVLTGSARVAQELHERARERTRRGRVALRQAALVRRRRVLEAQIAALQAELTGSELELARYREVEQTRVALRGRVQDEMARSRQADSLGVGHDAHRRQGARA